MAKKPSPLDVMNLMGGAAHAKAQPSPTEPDEDDIPAKPAQKKPGQVAAMKEKSKGNAPKSPKIPKPAGF